VGLITNPVLNTIGEKSENVFWKVPETGKFLKGSRKFLKGSGKFLKGSERERNANDITSTYDSSQLNR
jgi:hypothetical protein